MTLFPNGAFASIAPLPSRPDWQIGANTAISGYGLFEAIETLRKLNLTPSRFIPWGSRLLRRVTFPASSLISLVLPNGSPSKGASAFSNTDRTFALHWAGLLLYFS
jgi:hypothetical protein